MDTRESKLNWGKRCRIQCWLCSPLLKFMLSSVSEYMLWTMAPLKPACWACSTWGDAWLQLNLPTTHKNRLGTKWSTRVCFGFKSYLVYFTKIFIEKGWLHTIFINTGNVYSKSQRDIQITGCLGAVQCNSKWDSSLTLMSKLQSKRRMRTMYLVRLASPGVSGGGGGSMGMQAFWGRASTKTPWVNVWNRGERERERETERETEKQRLRIIHMYN